VGADALQVGDEVIQQLVEKDGAIGRGGNVRSRGRGLPWRKIQEARALPVANRARPERLRAGSRADERRAHGHDQPRNLKRAGELKTGDEIKIAPADGSAPFAGAIYEIKSPDSRKRLELLVNSRAAARLKYGEPLRVFMPGTGGPLPEGRSGIPTPPVKKIVTTGPKSRISLSWVARRSRKRM